MWNPFSDATQGAVKGFGEAIKSAVSAFKADPTKVTEFEAALEQARMQLEQSSQAAINATMQAESKSEHWAQWLWRPTIGFTFSGILVNNYILVPYMAQHGVTPIPIPPEVWSAMLVILGASAAGRSWEKVKRETSS